MSQRLYEISKKAINQLPKWTYSEPITVVSRADQLHVAILRLIGHKFPESIDSSNKIILGMDLEWKPMFERDSPYNRTALIQLYAPHCPILIRLNKLVEEAGGIEKFQFPILLKNILTNPNIAKVGLGVTNDVDRLRKDFNIECSGSVDIVDLPNFSLFGSKSMRALTAMLFKWNISKKETISNWENDKLTLDQIRYAASDAYLSRELYMIMKEQPEKLHQLIKVNAK